MLPLVQDYNRLSESFRWVIPKHHNIGIDVCDRWAKMAPERPAILAYKATGAPAITNYGVLQR